MKTNFLLPLLYMPRKSNTSWRGSCLLFTFCYFSLFTVDRRSASRNYVVEEIDRYFTQTDGTEESKKYNSVIFCPTFLCICPIIYIIYTQIWYQEAAILFCSTVYIVWTPNLSTDADGSTNIFVSAGVQKGLKAFFFIFFFQTHFYILW